MAHLLAVVALNALVCAAQPPEFAANGDMEAGQPGRPPDGWVANSYGELATTLEQDASVAHEGGASLRLECVAYRGGAAQAYLPLPPVVAGQVYTLQAHVRGTGLAAPVRLSVRDVGRPYHSYLGVTQLVTDEWRSISVAAPADADGQAVGIFVHFKSPGTLWLDDLSLVASESPPGAPPSVPAIVKGNLVQNSGFEVGLQGWTMPEAVAIEQGGVDGGHCAQWHSDGRYRLEGRPVALKPGQRYSLSAYLRAPNEGTVVQLSAREVGGSDRPHEEFAVGADWARHAFSFTALCEQNQRYYLSIGRTAGEDFLVDNVQLEEGELTECAPALPLEVGFDFPRAQRFPRQGEPVRLSVLTSARPEAERGPVNLIATDISGNTLLTRSLSTRKRRASVTLSFPETGFVSLALVNARSDPPTVLDEAQLCVVPERPAEGDSFFGCHGTVGTPPEYHALTAMSKGGTAFWRLHDMPSYAQWFMVEPEKGEFVWYDEPVDAMLERGVGVLGVLCRTPDWAGRDPGGEKVGARAWPPRDWDEFANYVYRTVDHYKGKINHWEVWNEPWGRGFWAGTPEEYGELLQIAYTEAKRADPECVVVGGCFWPPKPEFTDRVLATGAIQYMDAVSYHHYCEPDAIAMGQVRSWYETLRGQIDAASGEHLPIWMTEGSTACPSFYWWLGRREASRGATEASAKHLIETKSLGVETFFHYYSWQEIGSPRMFHGLDSGWYVHPLLEYDGSPKPSYAAYAATAQMLSGAEPAGCLEEGAFRIHAFAKPGATVLAMWARGALLAPRVLHADLGASVTGHDMMGVPVEVNRQADAHVLELRTAPVYVTVEGMAPEDVMSAIKAAVDSAE